MIIVRYDNCYNDLTPPKDRMLRMRQALDKVPRSIFFCECEWGLDNPATWSKGVGNTWRTTGDIKSSYQSMLYNIDQNNRYNV